MLLYLNITRPDISFSIQQLSQHVNAPTLAHWNATLHLLRHLKTSITTGLFLHSTSDFQLQAFSDSDWAQCRETEKSITGYCVYMGKNLISWRNKKQRTVPKSSAEAEYSLSSTVLELQWISYLLKDFGISLNLPIPLFCDNQAVIYITENPVFHERTITL